MRCTQCDIDVPHKDRRSRHRCPSCSHPFVTEPQRDGITDRFLARALEIVSAGGQFFFLDRQLTYEIRRRALRRARARFRWGCFFVVAAALTLWPVFASSYGFLLLTVVTALTAAGFFAASRRLLAVAGDARQWAKRWLAKNPSERQLTGKVVQQLVRQDGEARDLGAASFDRVLVCQRPALVDFFLANEFHFHYSCPVLGSGGYPEAVHPDMLARLKENPELAVFVLHDLSPEGAAFAWRVENHDRWFGDHPTARHIDVGLRHEQRDLFRRLLVPLGTLVPEGGSKLGDAWRDGMGAEVEVLRPELLIRLVGACLHEEKPLHLLAGHTDSGSGYG